MTLRAILVLALAFLLASTAARAADKAAPTAKDPVVARINGFEIHRSDIQDAAQTLPPQLRQQPANKLYSIILSQMVGTTLAAQAARREKLQDTPLVKRRMQLIEDQVLAQSYMDDVIRKNVTEAKVKAAYDRYLKTAPPREEVKARHILLASEADAKAVIQQLKKGADFATLAKEKTTDPAGKTSGGDLGWFTKDQMVPAFADAAFKLKKGEFSRTPVKTQFGWHVIKVEDRRVAKPPSFDEVKQGLANQLVKEVVAQRMQELRKTAKIEVFNGDGSKPGAPPPVTAPAPHAPAPQAVGPGPNLLGGAPAPEPQTGIPVLSPATRPNQ
jgi:peptidyl-prolyl cis-trans isomerase C